MADRIDSIEHDGEILHQIPKVKPLTEDAEQEEFPLFSDAKGIVFKDHDNEPDDDDFDCVEPKGFDPIKSRYLEGTR